jgi:hypothetical protein
LGCKPFRYLSADNFWHAEDLLLDMGCGRPGMLVIADIDRGNKSSVDRAQLTLYGFTHQGWIRHPQKAERAFVEAALWITKARCAA